MFHFEAQAQDKVLLIKWQFVLTHVIRQTKIPAPVDSWQFVLTHTIRQTKIAATVDIWVITFRQNVLSSKICFSLFFSKNGTFMCWSIHDLLSIFHLLQNVYLRVKTNCYFVGNITVIKSLTMSQT